MNPTGLWAVNANIQILTALVLILLLLIYTAFHKIPLGFSRGKTVPSKGRVA